MPQNIVEKIAQSHALDLALGHLVQSGDFLRVRPAHVMTHDNTGAVIPKFKNIGATSISDPEQPVFTVDHDVQNTSEANLAKYAGIAAFAEEHGVRAYPPGRGIGHQVLCEEGFVLPGTMVVASDSHSNIYGGLGALGTPVVRTDAAALWATAETWYVVPKITRVVLTGALSEGVTGKDVIITLCGEFSNDEVLNHAIEFSGEGVRTLSVDERLAIANMTTEWGALAGVFPCDGLTTAWLRTRLELLESESRNRGDLSEAAIDAFETAPPRADEGASYAQTIHLDLSKVRTAVSGPDHVKVMRTIADISAERLEIQKAYLLSCVNGRADDLSRAASVLEGEQIAAGVELYVAAASSEVQAEVERRGDWAKLEAAGAKFLPAGCGPCIGLGVGLLGENEIGISATNRNFKGRMGDRSAKCYLGSPEVVAASAVAGFITGPMGPAGDGPAGRLEVHEVETPAPAKVEIREGFPAIVTGELVLLDADNLNTDGIYGKDVTYQDHLTPEEMATHAFTNYDPEFRSTARAGDVLISGFNFGTGSSREQAATCIKFFGIPLVIAGSFSETYKRNAFNNGFLCIECPELLDAVRESASGSSPTERTGIMVEVDFSASVARAAGKDFPLSPLGPAAQDLVLAGGLEQLVRKQLQGTA
jgi:homoaconitate hydratase